ncbi:MAG: hypothetical protein IT270_07735, partial [Saprospiraceae bacterium]|nr:hypothetical protein [Saprospiraceae bacterium]
MKMLFAGMFISFLGSLPPGLISLSVARTALLQGLAASLVLAFGAATAEYGQALVAVKFADWFAANPHAERYFQWGALPVFGGLGIYLLFFARSPQVPEIGERVNVFKQFTHGVVISAFNLLAIPYWFAYVALLRVQGAWENGGEWVFAAGVTLGTMAAMLLYGLLGQLVLQRSEAVAKVANRVVGGMFLALALQVVWKL